MHVSKTACCYVIDYAKHVLIISSKNAERSARPRETYVDECPANLICGLFLAAHPKSPIHLFDNNISHCQILFNKHLTIEHLSIQASAITLNADEKG